MQGSTARNRKQNIPIATPSPYPLNLIPVEWFAYRSDDPKLSGLTFTGETYEAALINARAYLSRFGKARNLQPIITIKDE